MLRIACVTHIAFALIPRHATHREGNERVQHAIELRRYGIQCSVPFTGAVGMLSASWGNGLKIASGFADHAPVSAMAGNFGLKGTMLKAPLVMPLVPD